MASSKYRPDELVDPSPSALIESLRSVGYNTPTAVADIVDNSISAGAKHIEIVFHWSNGKPFVTLADNGTGMSEEELTEAMRAGSRSPLDHRKPNDLGRFGLGLKTASFSQARGLTVFTKQKDSPQYLRCWDLDYVESKKTWRLLKDPHDSLTGYISPLLEPQNGTVVVWSNLDRLLRRDDRDSEGSARTNFNLVIRDVSSHLSMVFHRFLSGEAGLTRKITIKVNGTAVHPWDPFALSHPATQNLGASDLEFQNSPVDLVGYVLPHKSKLTPDEFENFGGRRGWSGQQGFYVYRNHRLLV
ncbi:MAG: ATP-binding protein, partial [Cytophagaceae bacterium]